MLDARALRLMQDVGFYSVADMKLRSLQMMRGVAANLVIASHFVSIEAKYGQGYTVFPKWLTFAGGSGVHCFFVISGCVMAIVAGRSEWFDFISDRLTRIFPIYWVYTTVTLAVFITFPAIVNSSFAHAPSVLKSYLLWPDDVGPLLAVGWTLFTKCISISS